MTTSLQKQFRLSLNKNKVMKKTILLSIGAFILCTNTKAQIVTDTVSTGAGYINDVWYSLENDELGAATSDNWDIAFSTTGQSSTSILINSEYGVELWSYPHSNISGWATVDSAGIESWSPLYNSATSWDGGAFNTTADATDPFDVGWGNYNMATHAVTGDSIYIIKLTDGTYKKLWIESLVGSTFSFKYADLDGLNEVSATLDKTNYSNKLFGYYSIVNGVELDREPSAANSWDLVFKKQTAFIPTPYAVTSVLTNDGVEVASIDSVNASTYIDWSSQTFSSEINTIGGDWKSFNMTTYQYEIDDSLVYFVKDLPGDVWKLVFTGFGGSANGNYIFTKEKISLAGLSEQNENYSINTFKVYPNPASTSSTVTLVYNAKTQIKLGSIKVYNTLGKQVLSSTLSNNVGLNTQALSTATLKSGLYFVVLETENQRLQQKLIVQ